MKYLALIYVSEKDQAAKGEAHMKALFDEYWKYEEYLKTEKPGKRVAGRNSQTNNGRPCSRGWKTSRMRESSPVRMFAPSSTNGSRRPSW